MAILAACLASGVIAAGVGSTAHGSTTSVATASHPLARTRTQKVDATIAAATAMVAQYPYSWGGGKYYGASLGTCCSAAGDDGSTTIGFDCSGLMEYVFARGADLKLTSTSRSQYAAGPRVPIGQLQPGDMVFWAGASKVEAEIHHVALYAGNGQIVESVRSSGPRIRSVSADESTLMPYVVRPIN